MRCDSVLRMLDDYVDNRLIGEEPALVARHLASCRDCAREAESLRALLREASKLPRDVPPRHDLWPLIQAEVERGRSDARTVYWFAGAAAAAVLVVLAGALLVGEFGKAGSGGGAGQSAGAGLALEVRRAEAEYGRARRELIAVMGRPSQRVSPETRRVIDENLVVIDGAIAEIRASLEKDPENVCLFEMLVAEQDRGLRLLGLEQAIESDSW